MAQTNVLMLSVVCFWCDLLCACALEIPKQLLITGKQDRIEDMPRDAQDNLQRIVRMNPEMSVRFLGDTACLQYIRAHYDPFLEMAFKRAERGAYRGDICRAAVLFREGGFYLDVDLQLVRPLRSLVDSNTTFMSVISAYGGVMNALMGVTPRNAVLDRTIEEIRQWYNPVYHEVRQQASALGAHASETNMREWASELAYLEKVFSLPKTDLPMGPVTMLRALQAVVNRSCPDEYWRVAKCGHEGDSVKDTWGHCLSEEPQWSCGAHAIRLYGEARLDCTTTHIHSAGADAELLAECPPERVGKEKSEWPTQFGLFQKAVNNTRRLVGWSHFAGCRGFGCGSGGNFLLRSSKKWLRQQPL